MGTEHLLNLDVLAQEDVNNYALLRFEGREAISEPFDYHLELITTQPPQGANRWIGQLVEWTVALTDGDTRTFAGRIFETRQSPGSESNYRVLLRVRPAYQATAYARATHFIQDRDANAIFSAMTADVAGLVTDIALSPAPPKRGYTVRYDETEFDFLDRLLAQDGIFYFFTYDRGAGPYHHKMHVANAAGSYKDVKGGDQARYHATNEAGSISTIAHAHRAFAGRHDYHAFDVNKLDTPWTGGAAGAGDWGKVYTHSYEHVTGEAAAGGDLTKRGGFHDEAYAQNAETISGSGDDPNFLAGGRIAMDWNESGAPQRVVLTSVTHSAVDPWMLGENGGSVYRNSFTAMDATKVFRPKVPLARKRAPGPVLGVVALKGAADGEAKIDGQSRIPVAIAQARDYGGKLPEVVWLPVQQQWAAGTHGAQFFPRIGTRVVIDFLYGDPDLPFISGTMYNPAQKYPFDPAAKATQTGWRSVTDKNGGITQEFLFEDKPGAEEIQLTTDRDYRRMVHNDDWGTVDRDQTLLVKRDQKLTVDNDRTVKITGKQDTAIEKTRTVVVTDKSFLESKKEIEFKVGPSTIVMNAQGITIKAPKITVKADMTLDVSAGAKADYKAPMTNQSADALMVIKGGLVKIN